MPTTLDWTCGALAKGLRCYRSEEFFEAHEHWEAEWLSRAEPEKTFLQALIQVSAAFHHLRRGNAAGCASLLGRALLKLQRYPETYAGIEVEGLRANIREWMAVLRDQGEHRRLPFPLIR